MGSHPSYDANAPPTGKSFTFQIEKDYKSKSGFQLSIAFKNWKLIAVENCLHINDDASETSQVPQLTWMSQGEPDYSEIHCSGSCWWVSG